jgi:hypothetical protein
VRPNWKEGSALPTRLRYDEVVRQRRAAVSISSLANGACGEHRRHDSDGIRLHVGETPAMSPKHRHEPGPPMTLGNMRGLGVQHLIGYSLVRQRLCS